MRSNYLVLIIACLITLSFASHADDTSDVRFLTFSYPVPTLQEKFRFELSIGKDDARATLLVDADAEKGKRVQLKAKPTGDWDTELEEILADLNDEPLGQVWCTDFLKFVGDDVHLDRQSATTLTYIFSPQPAETDDEEDRKFLSHMIASLTINKQNGELLQFQMRNKESFRPIFIAKIESFKLNAECVKSEVGYSIVTNFETKVSGKIGFSRFEEYEFQHISELVRVGMRIDD